MPFDAVHDTQRVFRALLLAFSRPGSVGDIAAQAAGIDVGGTLSPSLLALAFTLLDSESSFCLLADPARGAAAHLSALTGCPAVPCGEARFVLAPRGEGTAHEALRQAPAGTPLEPHRGATLLLEVQRIGSGSPVVLEGPGIDGSARLDLEGIDPSWVEVRAERCAGYPLGLDIAFVDPAGRIAAVPRTSRLRRGA
jgi:alpha-D-ribose 1-methylphosphonate 5-triphosphate synthase subunit PhnH